VRGLKRKLDDLQPAPGAPSALRDRIAYVDDTLLAEEPVAEAAAADEGGEVEVDGTEVEVEKRPTQYASVVSKTPL
jgi:hypothetical protein